MALFGEQRDISVFRHINRELLNNIITQEVAFYKCNLEKTKINIYGEADGIRYFSEPVLLNCRIERTDPNFQQTDIGRDFNRTNKFWFLKDDLITANIYPELGDIIYYYGDYYEVEQAVENQLNVGKNPDYPYSPNPYNAELERFGWSVSIGYTAHYITPEKVNIERGR